MKILKFSFDIYADRQIIGMPEGASILTIQVQCGAARIWALCDETKKLVSQRIFVTYGTGDPISASVLDPKESRFQEYVGTFQMDNGEYIRHVFEEKR